MASLISTGDEVFLMKKGGASVRRRSYSRTIDVRAAGGVIWRRSKKSIEVVLIHRPRYDDWSFPKGKLKQGEDLRSCAIREIFEETRLHVALGQPAGVIRYRLGNGQRKEVTYWMAQELPSDHPAIVARPSYSKASKNEIDGLVWLPLEQAIEKLTSELDRAILRRLRSMKESGTLETSAVLLVRHARAVKRSNWKKGNGSEVTRPLTPRGVKQSKVIAAQLANYGVTQLHSSPWKRCMDTLRPFEQAARIRIVEHPELTEHAFRDSPEPLKQTMRQLLCGNTPSIAVCLHRPTLESVFRRIAHRTTADVVAKIPREDPYLKPGEILVAHVARVDSDSGKTRVVAVEKFRPTTLAVV
ncbi:NUDIX hydrolase [Changpingibacter yushuensis]|uniref:NUDIX hydrolase n=1 Tax=Changpingibacter yushuensis TaxID=2758440 RepID=UPI00165E5C13|nr:NUDIX hydrolase [Changpingibacter yushuensis]